MYLLLRGDTGGPGRRAGLSSLVRYAISLCHKRITYQTGARRGGRAGVSCAGATAGYVSTQLAAGLERACVNGIRRCGPESCPM